MLNVDNAKLDEYATYIKIKKEFEELKKKDLLYEVSIKSS